MKIGTTMSLCAGIFALSAFTALGATSDFHGAKMVKAGNYAFTLRSESWKAREAELSWGQRGDSKNWWLASLRGRYRGAHIVIPASAYRDLYDVRAAEVVRSTRGTVLVVTGGDGDHAYKARLWFKKGVIFERTVRDGRSPDGYFERTTYKFERPVQAEETD